MCLEPGAGLLVYARQAKIRKKNKHSKMRHVVAALERGFTRRERVSDGFWEPTAILCFQPHQIPVLKHRQTLIATLTSPRPPPTLLYQPLRSLSVHRPRFPGSLFDFVPAPARASASASASAPPHPRCHRVFLVRETSLFPAALEARPEAGAGAAGMPTRSGGVSAGPRGDGGALSAFDVVNFADEMEIREMVWRYGDEKRVGFILLELRCWSDTKLGKKHIFPQAVGRGMGCSFLNERDISCVWFLLLFSGYRGPGTKEGWVGFILCRHVDQGGKIGSFRRADGTLVSPL